MGIRLVARFIAAVLLGLASLTGGAAVAQPAPAPSTAGVKNVPLWPGVAPGSEHAPKEIKYRTYGDHGHRVFWNIGTPVIAGFYAAKPNGAAMLILPGGGYHELYVDAPAVDVAHWLNTLGADAFVLMYRLPDEGHTKGYLVPVQDGQRAMRLIRSGILSQGTGHKIDPARVGVMGFSAGGHLAAVLATHPDDPVYGRIDNADAVSARPDLMVLFYPPLQMPVPAVEADAPNFYRMYQKFFVMDHITATTPPALVFHGDKDPQVSYLGSVKLADSMKSAGASAELHVFPGIGHGFGMNGKGPEGAWPDLCVAWLRARGFLPPAATAADPAAAK